MVSRSAYGQAGIRKLPSMANQFCIEQGMEAVIRRRELSR